MVNFCITKSYWLILVLLFKIFDFLFIGIFKKSFEESITFDWLAIKQ